MSDAAAEPLISNTGEFPDDGQHEDEEEDVEIDESALVSSGRFIWGLTVCAGVSGLLFGYEYVKISHLRAPRLSLL
jgi:SP family myo-inositol transporter-like MFS transporter 13